MSDITGLVGGLAQGLNAYLGTQFQAQNQMAQQKQLIDYQTQRDAAKQSSEFDRQSKLETQRSGDELQRQKDLEDYKNSKIGSVDETAADKALPGMSPLVSAFKKTNGRYPNVKEFNDLTAHHPGANGMTQVDGSTLGELASLQGASDDEVQRLKALPQMPTGLAETTLKHLFEKGVNTQGATKLYMDMDPQAAKLPPEELGKRVQELQSNLNEPGKITLASFAQSQKLSQDEAVTKLYGALDTTLQQAMSNGKSSGEAMVLGSQLISKYDKKTKNMLILRMRQDMQKSQQQQPQAPQQGQ